MTEYAFIYGICSFATKILDELIPTGYIHSLIDRNILGTPHSNFVRRNDFDWINASSLSIDRHQWEGEFSEKIEQKISKKLREIDEYRYTYSEEKMRELSFSEEEIKESLEHRSEEMTENICEANTLIFIAFELKDKELFEQEAEHLQERYGLSIEYFQKP
jgi:hypothetical protein